MSKDILDAYAQGFTDGIEYAHKTCYKKPGRGNYVFCSVCSYNLTGNWANYCPNCGAKVVPKYEAPAD